jgi:VWFA-related protein
LVLTALVLTLLVVVPALAQQQSGQTQKEPPKQQAPTEAGGPEGDIGPYAIPKKPEDKTPPPPPRETPKPIEGMPNYSVTVDVPLVSLDVLALTKDGTFIPKLSKDHFRVLEDGVPQKLQTFSRTEAPLTAVLLVEFSNTYYQILYDALNAAYSFADSLKKDDYVAVIEYDMKPNIIQDFTQDKNAVYGALHQMRIPGFSESNMFDALYDTLDRVDRIEGRKEIILIGTGLDTFSKINFDKILKKVKETPNVTIFCISTGFIIKNYIDSNASRSWGAQMASMDFQMANNHLRTFAKLTGGQMWEPRFESELPAIFRDVSANVRNQYSLTYKPSNTKQDGTYRKLKVELVAPGTETPLIIKDEKGKNLKYQLVYREGYTARHEVE